MSHRDQPPDPEPLDRRRLITSSVVTLFAFILCLFLPAELGRGHVAGCSSAW